MEFYNTFLIILCVPSICSVSGSFVDDILEIQPMNPTVREGDDVSLTCFSPVPGTLVSWFLGPQTTSVFQRIKKSPFPGGSTIHLGNASTIPGKESSSATLLCETSVNNEVVRKMSTVTVVTRNSPMAVTDESGLRIFPANPVARNGTNFTLTCLAPSENTSDIGWYVPGVATTEFERYEMNQFDNGATLTLFGVNVESKDTVIQVACVQNDKGFTTKQVEIRVTEMIPTTESPTTIKPKGPAESSSLETPIVKTTPDSEASFVQGVSLSLVLTAIGIGGGLAVFMVCLIFLSVYVLVVFRSQGWGPFKSSENFDDVFQPSPRTLDSHRPYQSLGDKDEVNNSRGLGSRDAYDDLRQYEEPRVYMRLESKSSAKPQKQEHVMPEAIYDSGNPAAVQMTSFRNLDSKEEEV